jgi:hypothetical protein
MVAWQQELAPASLGMTEQAIDQLHLLPNKKVIIQEKV